MRDEIARRKDSGVEPVCACKDSRRSPIPRYGRPVLHRGSEMGLRDDGHSWRCSRWAIVALAGCAASGPNMMAEPCGGFYMCQSWH